MYCLCFLLNGVHQTKVRCPQGYGSRLPGLTHKKRTLQNSIVCFAAFSDITLY